MVAAVQMPEVQVQRLRSDSFRPREVPYLDVFKLFELYAGLVWRAPTIIVGPKGSGKTVSVQAFAHEVDSPIITFDCSEDVRRTQLVGSYILRGDQTPFVLGPLPTAFEVANEQGKCILVLEEVNALSPQSQKILNAISDWRRRIEVPEAQRVFELKGGAKLWITGTMNSSVYGGVHALNEDLKSRFRFISVGYPSAEDEEKIVRCCLKASGCAVPGKLAQLLTLAKETRNASLNYALSTRDVVHIAEDMVAMTVEKALRLALGKFEDTDFQTVVARIRSLFGVEVK